LSEIERVRKRFKSIERAKVTLRIRWDISDKDEIPALIVGNNRFKLHKFGRDYLLQVSDIGTGHTLFLGKVGEIRNVVLDPKKIKKTIETIDTNVLEVAASNLNQKILEVRE